MTATDTTASAPTVSSAERTVSAIFKEREQIDNVIRRLLDRGTVFSSSAPQVHLGLDLDGCSSMGLKQCTGVAECACP